MHVNQNEQMRGQEKDNKILYKYNRVVYPTRNCRKNQYDNKKGCPKFEMATYTKEIVKIK